jgi:hypothetical protein
MIFDASINIAVINKNKNILAIINKVIKEKVTLPEL